jgi:uncharacterized protein (DUF1015 family)
MTIATTDLARPFAGLRPAANRADEIAAPPYDVVTSDEARALAKDKPYSFLHVSRAEIDLPPDTDPYSEQVYTQAGQNLKVFEEKGILIRDESPAFYVYRMTTGDNVQTGVAFSASIDAYLDNRIRKHELTRPLKENDRVRQIEGVDAQTGPVLTVYRADRELAEELARVTEGKADAVVPELHGVRHEMWVVSNPHRIARIAERLNQMQSIYIADGHHRSAAAARVADARRATNTSRNGTEPYAGFLAVGFPDAEVTILDYNRLVKSLHGNNPEQFLRALEQHFELISSDEPVTPVVAYTFGMYLDGRWFTLKPKAPLSETDPVEKLDVRILDRLILEPILGIEDSRTDARIDFVGGSRGTRGLSKRIDSGEMAVGFTLFPTSLADLMAVADAGRIMPPKSTWFDPKLADGLISLPLS